MAEDFLNKIIQEKRKEIKLRKKFLPREELIIKLEEPTLTRDFKEAISTDGPNLIAEIKKASPSRGVLINDFDPIDIARQYQRIGAKGLSILTDNKFFGGEINHLKEVRKISPLPILRKDFIIDAYQIYESRFYGADAILLIADLLSDEELQTFINLAKTLELDSIVEVSNEQDLKRALNLDNLEIIGINNRNLHTFKVDLKTTQDIMAQMPGGKVVISESGIQTHKDWLLLKKLKVSAVLIGEAFITSGDIIKKAKEIMEG